MLRAILTWLSLSSSAIAAPVSQSYLCTQGHEDEAATKLQSFAKQSVLRFFKARRIEINQSTLQIGISASTQPGLDGPSYVSFAGNTGGAIGLTRSSVAGTVSAQDGTKFSILFSSGSDLQDAAEYRVKARQRGFDKEGNAIGRHCALQIFYSGDGEATKTSLVLYATSGHVLGRIGLPSRISLY
jgi:hypothetical protein